jgi:class 3 adenylate cyclase
LVSHLDLYWEEPSVARFFRRLASFSRLIVFDKRGIGLSDPVALSAMPTLEERMDDVRAVLDGWEDNYEKWGTDEFATAWVARLAPSAATDGRFVEWAARVMRTSASPATAAAFTRMNAMMDVREILPLIRVPTLVLEREETSAPKGPVDMPPLEEAAWVAKQIPEARMVVLPGRDYLPWVGDQDSIVNEVAAFISGGLSAVDPEQVLLTVLFTDIVGSTKLVEELGDRRWRELLERHNAIVSEQLARHRGTEVDRAGDGVLATFDGPARAIRCACEIAAHLRSDGIEIRAGIHAGEVELMNGRIGGIAVHVGARVASKAKAGEVLVTSTVKDLVAGSGVELEDRGSHLLKGVEGRWRLVAAVGESSRAP